MGSFFLGFGEELTKIAVRQKLFSRAVRQLSEQAIKNPKKASEIQERLLKLISDYKTKRPMVMSVGARRSV